jgi:hypothetical protein
MHCNHDSDILVASVSELEGLSSAGSLYVVLPVLGGSSCSDTCICAAAATGKQNNA